MTGSWPLRGSVGLILVAVFWTLNWSLVGIRTHWGFFPLWLGYCLTIDAWTFRRSGTSLWARGRKSYLGLFLISAPAWWLFEAINQRTGNWVYEGRGGFNDLEYVLWASLSFSTVIPAVFGTAEWVGTLGWFRKPPYAWRFDFEGSVRMKTALAGMVMLALTLVWPTYFFPLVWLSVFFFVDPINDILGHRSLLRAAAGGDWRPMLSLALGALICGFFWEMWNFYSYPKWTYRIPFVDFLRLFEMPVLGYGGYLPFAWELFALYHLVMGRLSPVQSRSFVRLVEPHDA